MLLTNRSSILWVLWFMVAFISNSRCDFPDSDKITVPITYDNLSESNKSKRNVVVLLIHKYEEEKIKSVTRMLDNTLKDELQSDLIIFHHDYPTTKEMEEVRNNTKRYIDFVNVDICLSRAPDIPYFDLYKTNPSWYKRGKWSYHNMIRFWFSDIFHLNVMKNVDYYMRIDDDSKFLSPFADVFKITSDHGAVYMANGQYKEAPPDVLPGIELLGVVSKRYVHDNHIDPRNPVKWATAFPDRTSYTYSTNFEVAKVDFFLRPEVRNFTDYILNEGGIYRYRWGDAPLRFVTLAMFATDREVLHRQNYRINYCHPC